MNTKPFSKENNMGTISRPSYVYNGYTHTWKDEVYSDTVSLLDTNMRYTIIKLHAHENDPDQTVCYHSNMP